VFQLHKVKGIYQV